MKIEVKINEYIKTISETERKERTVEQYARYLKEFMQVIGKDELEQIQKQDVLNYKDYLQEHYKPNTVNIKITVINAFLTYLDLQDYKLKQLKQQQKTTLENVLSPVDYERLLRIAQKRDKEQIYFIMRVLAEVGIRISELKYITVEAVKKGYAVFNSKGTVERQAFINRKLQKDLVIYCKEHHISTGIIFKSKSGKPLDNAYIYKEIQYLARTSESKKE